MDELKAKIREYSHLAASLSSQARSIPIEPKENRKRKLDLMRQARDASLQCQALIQELKKQQVA
ncbi:MAG: hypothetical protein ACYTXE_35060 [Nostoc sp.]